MLVAVPFGTGSLDEAEAGVAVSAMWKKVEAKRCCVRTVVMAAEVVKRSGKEVRQMRLRKWSGMGLRGVGVLCALCFGGVGRRGIKALTTDAD